MSNPNRDAMMRYCKAQAQINSVTKENTEKQKEITERVRTYRSLLHDELKKSQVTCCEVMPHGSTEPLYVRLKTPTQPPTIDSKLIVTILRGIDSEMLNSRAEKHGHDLPRMLVSIVSDEIKNTYTRKSNRTSLSISKSKERGAALPLGTSNEVRRLADELFKAQKDMQTIRKETKKKKQPHREEQELVQEEVKESLRANDSQNCVQRVHMTQEGSEWVYYLRCKESTRTESVGVRKAMPLLETVFEQSLKSLGLGREYGNFRPGATFWDEVTPHLVKEFDKHTITNSRLSLERGAPRS